MGTRKERTVPGSNERRAHHLSRGTLSGMYLTPQPP